MKILAIDDDETILELLRHTLEASGYTDNEFVSSGRAALAAMDDATKPFDCFLLDIQMPFLDGITVCRKIRARPEYKWAPIIMVTAMSDRSYIDQAFTAGATDYVIKPFDILELETRLNLAKKLIEYRALVTERPCAVASSGEKTQGEKKRSVREPVEIDDVARTINYMAFENYLLSLTRISLFQSSVFAIKVADIKEIHASHSAASLQRTLKSVAAAISDHLLHDCNFLSYRGNGVFVCISHRDSAHVHSTLEADLNTAIGEIEMTSENGVSAPIELVVGDLVSLGIFMKSGLLNYLGKAVESVEDRYLRIQAREHAMSSTKARSEINKQQYMSLLRDSLEDNVLPLDF